MINIDGKIWTDKIESVVIVKEDPPASVSLYCPGARPSYKVLVNGALVMSTLEFEEAVLQMNNWIKRKEEV